MAGVLGSCDAVMASKKQAAQVYVDCKATKFTAKNRQRKKFSISDASCKAKGRLVPLPIEEFAYRIRIGREHLFVKPAHPLHGDKDFEHYCKQMDQQLIAVLDKDLRQLKLFEYLRRVHDVCKAAPVHDLRIFILQGGHAPSRQAVQVNWQIGQPRRLPQQPFTTSTATASGASRRTCMT